eukprot:scaffold1435_cov267-Pinguiococcus_pyrenoidosus.AAC.8
MLRPRPPALSTTCDSYFKKRVKHSKAQHTTTAGQGETPCIFLMWEAFRQRQIRFEGRRKQLVLGLPKATATTSSVVAARYPANTRLRGERAEEQLHSSRFKREAVPRPSGNDRVIETSALCKRTAVLRDASGCSPALGFDTRRPVHDRFQKRTVDSRESQKGKPSSGSRNLISFGMSWGGK